MKNTIFSIIAICAGGLEAYFMNPHTVTEIAHTLFLAMCTGVLIAVIRYFLF